MDDKSIKLQCFDKTFGGSAILLVTSPKYSEKGPFYSRRLSERTLVARTDFRKFNAFSLEYFYKRIVILQKGLIVINRKMFQLVIDENRMVVTQKMTLIETFCGGTMYNVHTELASLVYIDMYM